jgi:hypothetical protein
MQLPRNRRSLRRQLDAERGAEQKAGCDCELADARAEVDELVSVDILQNRAVCALDVNGEGCANASRNVL